MNDFDTPQYLSAVTMAYAFMFYVAAMFFIVGLAVRMLAWCRCLGIFARRKSTRSFHLDPPTIVFDLILFRGKLAENRVAWVCSILFHFGLLTIVLRHLRYALDPAWLGPLWKIVEIFQPIGIYGGLAMIAGILGFILLRWGRRGEPDAYTRVDLAVLGGLVAIAVVGYLNAFVHTNVVAVKQFFVGLVSPDWPSLPSDPLLLLHLWLVAAVMILLPFSRLMHIGSVWGEETLTLPGRERKLLAGVALFALLVPALTAVYQVTADGWIKRQPALAQLVDLHRTEAPRMMIQYHPAALEAHRHEVIYQGVRHPDGSIEQCVTCHIVKGRDGQPVGFDDPRHFCRQCHDEAAVKIDCFECHNSKPAAIAPPLQALTPRTGEDGVRDLAKGGSAQ